MTEDEIIPDTIAGLTAYRYQCWRTGCRYRTQLLTRRRAELIQRIHRHRHAFGLAGIYHLEKE